MIFGPGIAPADILVSKPSADWNDVLITIAGTTDSMLLDDQDLSFQGRVYNRIESFVFQALQPDGSVGETVMSWSDFNSLRLQQATTAGNDAVVGTSLADSTTGGAGDDTLTALGGDDRLHGGTGADTLYGAHGDDMYVFNRGDGQDRIADGQGVWWFETSGANDTVLFGPGIAMEDIQHHPEQRGPERLYDHAYRHGRHDPARRSGSVAIRPPLCADRAVRVSDGRCGREHRHKRNEPLRLVCATAGDSCRRTDGSASDVGDAGHAPEHIR